MGSVNGDCYGNLVSATKDKFLPYVSDSLD